MHGLVVRIRCRFGWHNGLVTYCWLSFTIVGRCCRLSTVLLDVLMMRLLFLLLHQEEEALNEESRIDFIHTMDRTSPDKEVRIQFLNTELPTQVGTPILRVPGR